METIIEQGRGKFNKKYWTATFEWPKRCSHFCFGGKRDWMPKHCELAEIIETVLAIEPPEKREFLRKKFARALEDGMSAPVVYNGREKAEAAAKQEFLRKKFAQALADGMSAPVAYNGHEEAEAAANRVADMYATGNPDDTSSCGSSCDFGE